MTDNKFLIIGMFCIFVVFLVASGLTGFFLLFNPFMPFYLFWGIDYKFPALFSWQAFVQSAAGGAVIWIGGAHPFLYLIKRQETQKKPEKQKASDVLIILTGIVFITLIAGWGWMLLGRAWYSSVFAVAVSYLLMEYNLTSSRVNNLELELTHERYKSFNLEQQIKNSVEIYQKPE